MQRVPREKRCDRRAAPLGARHSQQNEEQQHRIQRVQKHTSRMVSPHPPSENLAIDHVGEPGYRMPVARVARLKSPLQPAGSHAPIDMRISRNVNLVVNVDKAKVKGGRVKSNGAKSKDQTNYGSAPTNF